MSTHIVCMLSKCFHVAPDRPSRARARAPVSVIASVPART